MERRAFPESDLIRVDASKCVVLNSGGPLMDVVAVDGDNALCEWTEIRSEFPVGAQVVQNRRLLPIACLSKLVPFNPNEGD